MMGIFSRTRDIIAANMTDMLDRAEDPAKMIRIIILEMEETLVEVRAGAARTIADQKEMRRHIDKLATAALVEKAKATDMADQMATQIKVLDDALRASEADIAKLQTKLREARTRQSGIETRIDSANQRFKMREAYAGERTKDAFSRFDILEREADLAEGRADAMGMGNVKTLDEEIAELRTDKKIDDELEAMKARIKAAGKKG
jgi:phage shock protein A